MASPRALTKQGSNVWSIANVLNGGGTNDSYHIYLRNGTLRFAPGSSFCMASTTTGSRNQFDVSVGGANNAMGLVVETNADVTIGSLGVQFSSSTTGTFYMAVNGGRLTMTAPDNPLGFGDSSNAVMTVVVNGGQWITVSDAAWCDLGTRCPLTWIQNGGFVSFGRPTFGRQNGSGSGRWFGGVNMSIFGGTFEARQLFSWKSTDYNAVTNSLTLGNGTPGQGKFSVPATKRYHTGGKVFFAFNGGVLETRGLLNSADGSMVGSLNDYLYGVDAITVGPGGAFIDTLTNSVAISQPLTKLDNDGGLVKLGAGTLVFSNSVSLAGPIAVSNGTLRAAGFSGTNDLFLASGGVLDLTPLTAISQSAQFRNVSGTGTASNGTLAVFGTLSPGSTNGAPGTLSAANLTLLAGAKLRYDWTAQTNDLFAVKGLLTAQAGGTVDFGHAVGDELTIPFSAVLGTYGTFSGAFGSWKAINTGLPANVAVSSTMTAQNGVVTLSIKYSGLVILIQ
jgi:autotransporter-associated beta strand protein